MPLNNTTSKDAEILGFFSSYIEKEIGVIYADHNSFQLRNRLEEICKLMSVASLNELHALGLKGISGAFRQLLLDVATNNETSFFRDSKVFKALEDTVLPGLFQLYPEAEKLRIWSAASSTGQEAVSVAILFEEAKLKLKRNFDFHIVGSDVSERALSKAREGLYSQLEVQRGLPAAMMIKYFVKDERDRWAVRPVIKSKMEFRKQNLKDSFQNMGMYGLILCRNVLIYQNVEGKKEILNRLTKQLLPGGYLIMGSGESLIGLSQDFQQVSIEGAVIYRKKDSLAISA